MTIQGQKVLLTGESTAVLLEDLIDKARVDAALGAKAPLDSPAFTGTPTAPTPDPTSDDTSLATTEFVKDAIGATGTGHLPLSGGTMSGAILGPAGSAALPSFAVGSANLGLFRPTGNTLGITAAGVERVRIDGSGLRNGASAAFETRIGTNALIPQLQQLSTFQQNSSLLLALFSASTSTPNLLLSKSRNATIGSHTIVINNDNLGSLSFGGSDGTKIVEAARIVTQVDAIPAADTVSGRIVFSTTPNTAAAAVTERMRINKDGDLQAGGANTFLTSTRHFQLRSYTNATKPSAAVPGQMIFISDIDGGTLAVSDGSVWDVVGGAGVVGDYVAKAGDTMTGPLILSGDAVSSLGAATLQQVASKANLAGDTFTGAVNVEEQFSVDRVGDAITAFLNIKSDAGRSSYTDYYSGANKRWRHGKASVAEGGANSGSPFILEAWDDTGVVSLGNVFVVDRATRVTGFVVSPTVPSLAAGDGSTKAVNALYVDTADNLRMLKTGGVFSGGVTFDENAIFNDEVIINFTPTFPPHAATKGYVDDADALLAPKAAPALTGIATLNGDAIATEAYVDSVIGSGAGIFLPLSGGIIDGGRITLDYVDFPPTSAGHAVHKGYVDTKAPLDSPAFTGTPTAPTQAAGNISTRIATTQFVNSAINAIGGPFLPLTGGTLSGILNMGGFQVTNLGTPTVASSATRKDYVDNADNLRMLKTGGTFTGTVNGVTAAEGDISTKLATTAFVDTAMHTFNFSPVMKQNIVHDNGANAFEIVGATADGADVGAVWISSGGAFSTARGATLALYGNEHASQPGNAFLQAGTGYLSLSAAQGVIVGSETPQGAGTFNATILYEDGVSLEDKYAAATRIITLRSLGVPIDGVTDCCAAFSAALDTVPTGTVLDGEGLTYKVTGSNQIKNSVYTRNITLQNMVIDAFTAINDNDTPPMLLSGFTVLDSAKSTVAGALTQGDKAIAFTGGGPYGSGDWIWIGHTSNLWSTDHGSERGELHVVSSATGTSMNIRGGMFHDMPAGAYIKKITFLEGWKLINIRIFGRVYGYPTGTQTGIYCRFMKDLHVEKCHVSQFDYTLLMLDRCYNADITHNYFGYGLGLYGFGVHLINGCDSCRVTDNEFQLLRQAVDLGNGNTLGMSDALTEDMEASGVNRSISIKGNQFRDILQEAISTHGSADGTMIEGNEIWCDQYADYPDAPGVKSSSGGILRGLDETFKCNKVHTPGKSLVDISNSVSAVGMRGSLLVEENVGIDMYGEYGIRFASANDDGGLPTTGYQNVSICQNLISGKGSACDIGIEAYTAVNSAHNVKSLKMNGNTITGFNDSIVVHVESPTKIESVDTSHNQVEADPTSGTAIYYNCPDAGTYIDRAQCNHNTLNSACSDGIYIPSKVARTVCLGNIMNLATTKITVGSANQQVANNIIT